MACQLGGFDFNEPCSQMSANVPVVSLCKGLLYVVFGLAVFLCQADLSALGCEVFTLRLC
jgi:hypothetical protein